MKKSVSMLIVMLVGASLVLSQEVSEIRFSGDFENTSLKEVLLKIEEEHHISFFFKDEWLSGIEITAHFKDAPLTRVLEDILYMNDLSYIVFNPYSIYLINEASEAYEATKAADSTKQSANLTQQVVKPETRERQGVERIVFGVNRTSLKDSRATLSGYIKEAKSGQEIIGGTVYVEELGKGAVSNRNGYYSLTVPTGEYHISYSFMGLKKETKQISLYASGSLDIELEASPFEMEEVVVMGEAADVNVSGIQMSTIKLDMKVIEQMPAFMGEVDVIKSLLLLPSVSTVGEGASGFNVRGGNTDQNLVLLDDAPIFNSSHAFGFFSAFHPDAIKTATLHSGGISAKYGGRLSSILDIQQKEGNLKEFTGTGGVGLVSSRLALEAPIVKDKCSFLIAGRSTYSDWILQQIPDMNVRNSTVAFYDATAKVSYAFNHKNKVSLSTYTNNDRFRFGLDTTYNWRTRNAVLKYNHIWGDSLFSDFTAIYSRYNYLVNNQLETRAFELNYGILYRGLKADFSYFSQKHQLDFGASFIRYDLQPGTLMPDSEVSGINPVAMEEEQSREMAIYLNDEYEINARVSIMLGLRYSLFHNLGPGTVRLYQDNIPKDLSTITDTLYYNSGELIKSYGGFEPRVSLKIGLGPYSSLKISYNRMRQYISLISNTAAMTPIDIWKTSNTHIRPQIGDQVIVGYFRNFSGNSIETSVEAYYKHINNLLEYKDGAVLLLNEILEADLLEGRGRAYGIEFMGKKKTGRLTGWASYVYSRSERLVRGNFPEETINLGKYYPSNYDKPHSVKFFGNYRITQRWSLSANCIYGTGRPFTAPYSKYLIDNDYIEYITVGNFSQRNQYRIQDYHRLDISVTLGQGHKKYRKWKGSWTFSVYNVYGRKNAYSVFFKDEYGVPPMPYRLSVLGVPFPSLTYNFTF